MAAKKPLTVKQEKFHQKFVECGNLSEAYRYAYNASSHERFYDKCEEFVRRIKGFLDKEWLDLKHNML